MNVALTFEQRKAFALEYLKDVLKVFAPKDTTNLSVNGIRIADNDYILIGGEVAPYAVYTNEAWVSERWNGRKNPNEGWINRAIESALPMLVNIMGGSVSEEEIQSLIANEVSAFDYQIQESINEKEKELSRL